MRYMAGVILATVSVASVAADAIYVNLDSGWARQSGLPSASAVNAQKLEHRNVPSVWNMNLGYNHDFGRYLGVGAEAGASYIGKATYTFSSGTSCASTTVISFMGELLGHLSHWDVVAKMGLARVNLDVSGINKGSRSRPHLEMAVGAAYPLSRHFALQGLYWRVFGSRLNSLADLSDTPTLNAVLLGVRITF